MMHVHAVSDTVFVEEAEQKWMRTTAMFEAPRSAAAFRNGPTAGMWD